MAEKEVKGIKKFFEEFKAFAMRGNVLDMAVGVVIGGAFTAIVNSLVNDIINPAIGLFFNADFSDVGIHAKFMKYTINFHIAYCSTGQRGQQDSSQGVAQSCTIASFQGFYNKLTVCAIGCHFSNFNARFFKFKHSFKPPFFMIECRRAYSPTALPLTSLHNR